MSYKAATSSPDLCLRCSSRATRICFETMRSGSGERIERFSYRCAEHTTGRCKRIPKGGAK